MSQEDEYIEMHSSDIIDSIDPDEIRDLEEYLEFFGIQEEVIAMEKKSMVSKVKDHAVKKMEYSPPHWLLYVLAAVAAIGLVYGTVQQFRVWRWNKLLKASHNRILKLETSKEKDKWLITKKLSDKAIAPKQEEVKKIEKKIEALERKEKEIDKSVDKMDPVDLLKAFKEEGFK